MNCRGERARRGVGPPLLLLAVTALGSRTLGGPSQFMVLTYNMLEKSLGSNCVPWVMKVSEEWQQSISEWWRMPFDEWKRHHLMPSYQKGFHLNRYSGDPHAMRGLWCARTLDSQDDIPHTLTSVRFVASNQVVCGECPGQPNLLTLKGLLKKLMPENDMGGRFFEHLMKEQDEVYDWQVRGPRLFREITAPRALGDELPPSAPDVVLLQEYDSAMARADYRGRGVETFCEAMSEAGYSYVSREDPAHATMSYGIGLFWKRGAFGLHRPPISVETLVEQGLQVADRSSPLANRRLGQVVKELRHTGLLRLEHAASNRSLLAVAVHLTTDAWDSKGTTDWPGKARAGEIRALRELIARAARSGEAVILAGDFNTNAGDLAVFRGDLVHVETGQRKQIRTNFTLGGDKLNPTAEFSWEANGSPLPMVEAFEGQHHWGTREVGYGERCTSMNAVRCKWLDYVFYSRNQLRPVAVMDVRAPSNPIPDREHGSDHLPLAVRFAFAGGASTDGAGSGGAV